MDKIGITIKKNTFKSSVLHGLLLPLVSIFVVLIGEQVIWKLQGNSGLFFHMGSDLYFSSIYTSSLAYAGRGGFFKWAVAGLAITLFRSVFYEFGFRGYFYFDVGEHFSYRRANLYQALGYTIMAGCPSIFILVRYFVSGRFVDVPSWVFPVVIIATIGNLMFLGLRQGNLRALTGSVWVCVFCFFLFDYFNNIFSCVSIYPAYLMPYATIFRSLAIQIVASILNIPAVSTYYKKMRNQFKSSQESDVDIDKIVEDILREDRRRQEEKDVYRV